MLMYHVKQALWLTLLMAGPVVLVTMAIGLILGFLQAVLQLQDQSFPFAIKLVGSILILMALGPWIADSMMQFTNGIFSMFDRL